MENEEKPPLMAEDAVRAAREWVGTRFHHQGRRKACGVDKGGCDCLGVLVGVAHALQLRARDGQLLERFGKRDYGHIPDGIYLKSILDSVMEPVVIDNIFYGDVVLMKLEQSPQHVAVVSDYPSGGLGIIHALASARKVVEHRLDAQWKSRIVSAYRIPGLN